MVYALLQREYQNDAQKTQTLFGRLLGMMDAVQANPTHGILRGCITETGDVAPIGLHKLNVVLQKDTGPFLETEEGFTDAIGGPLQRSPSDPAVPADLDGDGLFAMFTSTLGLNAEIFERDHPWFTRIGLDSDEQNGYLLELGDDCLTERLLEMDKAALEAFFQETPELTAAKEAMDKERDEDAKRRIILDAFRASLMAKPCPVYCPVYYLVFPDDEGHQRMLTEVFRSVVREMRDKRRRLETKYAGYL
jgi:hypothetical protein